MNLMPFLPPRLKGKIPAATVARQFGWGAPVCFAVGLVHHRRPRAGEVCARPLLAMLEDAQKQIAESLENAEKTRQELAKAQTKAQKF